jgi:protein-tyrosine phosphatase
VEAVAIETRLLTVCTQRQLLWDPEREPAACADPAHDHQSYQVHRHRDTVTLPDGSSVIAVSWDPDPYTRDQQPDHGLYLDPRWAPPWSHDHADWPDFGLPRDRVAFLAALRDVLERSRAGQRVEIGCVGGHGRTGTALAALAVLTGHPSAEAVDWVRANYCPSAVETPEQQAFIAELG